MRATAAEDGGHIAVAAAVVERADHEFGDAAVGVKIAVDERGGFFLRDAEALGETERALAVDDAEVDGFGAAALGGGDFVERDAEDLAGDERVDVVVAFEGGAHGGVLRVVGQDAELDLRVVGGQEFPGFTWPLSETRIRVWRDAAT